MESRKRIGAAMEESLSALRNTLPIFHGLGGIAGNRGANIAVRLIVSLLPLAMLAVTKVIIDSIYRLTANHTALPTYFWWLVVLEFGLACISTILVRITDYCDTVLADKYAKYVSVRIMQHASRLDLTSYEDATFQDKLERARVQGTDRVLMIQAAGRLIQEVVTTGSWRSAFACFSPWLLGALVVCVVPAFWETHAFLGYSLSFAQTPAPRNGIPAGSRREQRKCQGAKAVWHRPVPGGTIHELAMRLHGETARLARKRAADWVMLTLPAHWAARRSLRDLPDRGRCADH
jgi:ATP-binding cassette subfamily B protein